MHDGDIGQTAVSTAPIVDKGRLNIESNDADSMWSCGADLLTFP